jgi:hypothetical protein
MSDANERPDWAPQKARDEDGVYLTGAAELPVNHRLRAEELVARGAAEDPDGIVSPELIADTAARLQAEAAAAQVKADAEAAAAQAEADAEAAAAAEARAADRAAARAAKAASGDQKEGE